MLVGLMSGIAWSELLSASPGPRIPPEPVRAGSTVGQGGHPVNRVIKRNAHYLFAPEQAKQLNEGHDGPIARNELPSIYLLGQHHGT